MAEAVAVSALICMFSCLPIWCDCGFGSPSAGALSTAANEADDETYHSAQGPRHESGRHRGFEFGVMGIGRQLEDQAIPEHGEGHITQQGEGQTDAERFHVGLFTGD